MVSMVVARRLFGGVNKLMGDLYGKRVVLGELEVGDSLCKNELVDRSPKRSRFGQCGGVLLGYLNVGYKELWRNGKEEDEWADYKGGMGQC